MAKKKKENTDENDEINEGRSEDINEADDSFGLPNVEYSRVDKSEEEPVAKENEYTEPEHTAEPAYSSSSGEKTTSSYEPGSYRPPKEESNAPKIIILVVVLLLVFAGIWYFGFYRPQQQAELARIEKQEREAEEAKQAEQQRQAEAERQRQLEAQREAERLAAEEEAASEPQEGSFERLTFRTGNYYVIVASSLDADLATDYAHRLAKDGYNTKLLEPTGNNKFHRVAVAGFDTWAQAQEEADELKGQYGENVWVVKY